VSRVNGTFREPSSAKPASDVANTPAATRAAMWARRESLPRHQLEASVTRLNVSLEQYEIGLSGAVPDRGDWSEPAMDRGILEFVALFSGLVFKYGGRIVHGSHPTFTPVILRQARQHAGGRLRKPVTLVMSDLWARDLSEEDVNAFRDIAEFVVTKKIGDGGPEEESADMPEREDETHGAGVARPSANAQP